MNQYDHLLKTPDLYDYCVYADEIVNEGKFRKATGECIILGHTREVAESMESFAKDDYKRLSYCIGISHDVKEDYLKLSLEERSNFDFKKGLLRNYGFEGRVVDQATDLLDFKKFMPSVLESKGLSFKKEGTKEEIKRNNYSKLIRLLSGNYGENYFVDVDVNIDLAILLARVGKVCDWVSNCDFGKDFNVKYQNNLHKDLNFFSRKKKVSNIHEDYKMMKMRNCQRLWDYPGLITAINNTNFVSNVLDIKSFNDFLEENKQLADRYIQKNGTDDEKKVLKYLKLNYHD